MDLHDEYCRWLVAAEIALDEFEKKIFKIDYIENIKAHILEGHRRYKVCKAIIGTCEQAKIAKFQSMWPKLNELHELAYRCEMHGFCVDAMDDMDDEDDSRDW